MFLHKNIFFHFFFTHFLGQKIQKNIFFLKKYFPKLFLHKNIFLNLCAQKVTKFCSKKKNEKKIFLCKNNFGKYFFYKNKFGKNFFNKNKLENIFLEKKIWKYFFSCFDEGGGQLSGKFGYSDFLTKQLILKSNFKNFFVIL